MNKVKPSFVFERLTAQDVPSMRALWEVYAGAFEDPESYESMGVREDVYHFDISMTPVVSHDAE